MIHKELKSKEKIEAQKVVEQVKESVPQKAEEISLAKAPEHNEFSKLDEMLRFYFGFYKSHILHINVIKKDHYDVEMGLTPQQPKIA